MLNHKKLLFRLWRISTAVYLILAATQLFARTNPALAALADTLPFQIAIWVALGLFGVFSVLATIIEYQEKHR